jgi:hypothetical protein
LLRDFLYSETTAITGMRNLSDDPGLAITAVQKLCEHLSNLCKPRSVDWRSDRHTEPAVNVYGNPHFQNCGSNERNRAGDIWDQRSKYGSVGAMTSVVVPWLSIVWTNA